MKSSSRHSNSTSLKKSIKIGNDNNRQEILSFVLLDKVTNRVHI